MERQAFALIVVMIATILGLSWLTLSAFSMEMAVTVDDLPNHGPLPPGETRISVARKMLGVFEKHHLKGVYGFVNSNKTREEPGTDAVLKEWVARGQLLGNHTDTHPDFNHMSVESFTAAIERNEKPLLEWMGEKDFHYFRYPFLHEGNALEKRNAARKYLADRGYRIAQVTVDFEDWAHNRAYARCLKKKLPEQVAGVKKAFMEGAREALMAARELEHAAVGHEIRHILLLHIGALEADQMDELLTTYEKQGVKWISLDRALSDPVYATDPGQAMPQPYTFLNQLMKSKGLESPLRVKQFYAQLDEAQKDEICR